MASPAVQRVEFHTGLADPLGFACRLLRKAQRQGHRVLVTAPEARLQALDAQLWTFEPLSFVPHILLPELGAERQTAWDIAARTPIWLCLAVPLSATVPAPGLPGVLVNLGASAAPPGVAFERVIEIVSHDVDEAQAGRQRWRAYKASGADIVHHLARDEANPPVGEAHH